MSASSGDPPEGVNSAVPSALTARDPQGTASGDLGVGGSPRLYFYYSTPAMGVFDAATGDTQTGIYANHIFDGGDYLIIYMVNTPTPLGGDKYFVAGVGGMDGNAPDPGPDPGAFVNIPDLIYQLSPDWNLIYPPDFAANGLPTTSNGFPVTGAYAVAPMTSNAFSVRMATALRNGKYTFENVCLVEKRRAFDTPIRQVDIVTDPSMQARVEMVSVDFSQTIRLTSASVIDTGDYDVDTAVMFGRPSDFYMQATFPAYNPGSLGSGEDFICSFIATGIPL
jgi:hypothetical protein